MRRRSPSSGGGRRGRIHGRRRSGHPTPIRRSPRFLPHSGSPADAADLRHHGTPLRRSPRLLLLTQNNARGSQSEKPSPRNKARDSSAKKPRPIVKDSAETASAQRTHERCSMKRLNELPIYRGLRRSPRWTSNLARNDTEESQSISQGFKDEMASSAEKKDDVQKRVLRSRGATMCHSLRRSLRIASNSDGPRKEGVGSGSNGRRLTKEQKAAKPSVPENEKVAVGGMDDLRRHEGKEQRKRGSPVVLTLRERVERKRRKIRSSGQSREGNFGTENTEVDECCGIQGWTKEQEAALRRAYLTAKPSPHFWKKVSKMVPGKSAKDCFNRVHADLATPPQPLPRSRTNRLNASPLGSVTLSDCKSVDLTVPNTRRPRNSKQKSLIAQKTVRHLLRKHCLIDQNQEADLFSVLESSPISFTLDFPETKTPSTPSCMSKPPGFLHKCNQRSSPANTKMFSRFKTIGQANFDSPEVLKQVKNMALHEKYIDQLHCREARRKASTKNASSVTGIDIKNNGMPKSCILKAARNALICEAKDVIGQFQNMQANILANDNSFDIDDADTDSDDDDDD